MDKKRWQHDEGLSSVPSTHNKCQVGCSCNPGAQRDRRIPEAHWLTSLTKWIVFERQLKLPSVLYPVDMYSVYFEHITYMLVRVDAAVRGQGRHTTY